MAPFMCDVDVVNIERQIVQRRHSVGNHKWPVALIELKISSSDWGISLKNAADRYT